MSGARQNEIHLARVRLAFYRVTVFIVCQGLPLLVVKGSDRLWHVT